MSRAYQFYNYGNRRCGCPLRCLPQGMYNSYAAIKTYWSDTIFMDNIRGADAITASIPGAQEVSATTDTAGVTTWSGKGNTVHTLTNDSFY